jgi:hypothetical protein
MDWPLRALLQARQVGCRFLATLGQLEGHLRLGGSVAGNLLQPGLRVGDIEHDDP